MLLLCQPGFPTATTSTAVKGFPSFCRIMSIHSTPRICVSETEIARKERSARNSGSKPAHWVDGRKSAFLNPWPSWRNHDASDIFYITMQHSRRYPSVPENIDSLISVRRPTWGQEQTSEDKLKATWLGHACFYVEFPARRIAGISTPVRGARLLFDPVFSNRCSPSQWIGPKRFTPVPCSIGDIPEVDAIIISHNHYDHMDTHTIQTLMKRPNCPHIFAPLGNEAYFASIGVASTHTHILDWWDSRRLSFEIATGKEDGKRTIDVDITCTPAQHFTGRGILDRMKTLWSSWVIEEILPDEPESKSKAGVKAYFAGDTGYRAVLDGQDEREVPVCPAFAEIGQRFEGFDLAMIPIGAYMPRRFMSPIHCAPQDSVRLFQDVRAKRAIGMHWGTWILTTEDVLDPPKRLAEECSKAGVDADRFTTCDIGQTLVF